MSKFGNYQGTWVAIVEYKGVTGVVQGYYGSCSGCDAFEAEFNYSASPMFKYGHYFLNESDMDDNMPCTFEEYQEKLKDYDKRLSVFGESYLLAGLYDKTYYERKRSKLDPNNDSFDKEELEICDWVLKNL